MIFLHHTAGGHRPDWVVNNWKNDRNSQGSRIRVATAFVIGGLSTTTNDMMYDGKILRCFPEDKWAYHLGVGGDSLNKKSIGIEICNYGPLTYEEGRGYINYVNRVIPDSQVVELATSFRGYKYYHKYTEKQLDAVHHLLNHLCNTFGINKNLGLKSFLNAESPNEAFGLKSQAISGAKGIWTHTNVRQDKTDCSPQTNLVELIRHL